MPIVMTPGLDAAGFCAELKQHIQTIGTRQAFGMGKVVVAYSGPSAAVRGIITTSFTGNWERSQKQAQRLNGRRIDDTLIGQFLVGFDFRTYFTNFYGNNRAAQEQAEFDVWSTASTEFMRAQFKELATAVCAADPERVFRKYEISSVLKNRKVRVINNRSAQLFKDFHKISQDEAYRLFCLTELLEARKHARKESTREAWSDYHERRCFYFMQHQYELGRMAAIPADTKQQQKLLKKQALLVNKMTILTKAPSKPAAVVRKKAGMGRTP